MEPSVWPAMLMTSSSHEPTRTRAPSATGFVVGTGMCSASDRRWRSSRRRSPRRPRRGACQWSGCQWVVMTRARPASPIRPSRVVRLVGGVDQRLLAGERAAQEVGVVRHRADRDLGDDEVAGLARVGRAADLDLSGVAHGTSLPVPDANRDEMFCQKAAIRWVKAEDRPPITVRSGFSVTDRLVDSRRPRAQPQGRLDRSPARLAHRVHRPVRLGQVVPGVRHDLRRGPATLRRVAVGVRPPVPRPDGQARRRLHRGPVAGGLHRPEVHLAQPAVHRRHHHRGLRLPAPALRARRPPALPRVRRADRPADAAADRRPHPRAARRLAVPGARAGHPRPQGGVRRAVPPAAVAGLQPRARRRQAAQPRRRAAQARQAEEAHHRRRRRPAPGQGSP